MIQRIQSVYLLLVSVVMAITLTTPLLVLKTSIGSTCMGAWGGFEKQFTYRTDGVACLAILIILIAIVSIFLFKKRDLQLKLGWVNLILILLFYGTLATYYVVLKKNIESITLESVRYGISLPAIAFVFNLLAQLKIKKDEKLVKSLDRIR